MEHLRNNELVGASREQSHKVGDRLINNFLFIRMYRIDSLTQCRSKTIYVYRKALVIGKEKDDVERSDFSLDVKILYFIAGEAPQVRGVQQDVPYAR